MTARQNFLFYV